MLLVGPSIGKLSPWDMPLELVGANVFLVPGHGRFGGGGGGSGGGSGLGNSCLSCFTLLRTAIIDSRLLASSQAVRPSSPPFVT